MFLGAFCVAFLRDTIDEPTKELREVNKYMKPKPE
jgi:hypothetical protein